MAAAPPPAASQHYAASAALAARAAQQAQIVAARPAQVAAVVATYQAAQAVMSERAVTRMLVQQAVDQALAAAEAVLQPLAFTTAPDVVTAMVDQLGETQGGFDRLVQSLVQDAGRAAESVASAARPDVVHVRYLSPPSCSRCAVLAGRVYRWSDGFLRHPNCDCVMVPTLVANPVAPADPVDLMRQGLVSGLSKADREAINDGADFNQVVNVRTRAAGLREAGRVLYRVGKPTPEAIYRDTSTREEAVAALKRAGYFTMVERKP